MYFVAMDTSAQEKDAVQFFGTFADEMFFLPAYSSFVFHQADSRAPPLLLSSSPLAHYHPIIYIYNHLYGHLVKYCFTIFCLSHCIWCRCLGQDRAGGREGERREGGKEERRKGGVESELLW